MQTAQRGSIRIFEFELRPRGRTGIERAFYCFLLGEKVVVLHVFIRKSPQTPDSELKMARKRLKAVKKD
jgi:phage-related protein